MRAKKLKMILWVGIVVISLSATAWSQNPMLAIKGQEKTAAGDTENFSLPEDLSATQVDQIVAGLSDEQMRRLLINELKLQARQETTVEAKPEGVAGIIDKIKNLTALLQTRLEYLRAGGSASPQEVGTIYKLLGKGERGIKSVAGVIVSVAAVHDRLLERLGFAPFGIRMVGHPVTRVHGMHHDVGLGDRSRFGLALLTDLEIFPEFGDFFIFCIFSHRILLSVAAC